LGKGDVELDSQREKKGKLTCLPKKKEAILLRKERTSRASTSPLGKSPLLRIKKDLYGAKELVSAGEGKSAIFPRGGFATGTG